MTELKNLLDVIVETSGATLPDGFDSWAIKSVHPDLKTTHGANLQGADLRGANLRGARLPIGWRITDAGLLERVREWG